MELLQKKNISASIIGLVIFAIKTPNFNQVIFKGVNNLELKTPSNKKIKPTNNGNNFNLSSFKSGYVDIAKKIRKNKIPKLLLESTLISSI